MGVVAAINQTIDGDTAQLVTEELGHAVRRVWFGCQSGLESGPDAGESLERRAVVLLWGMSSWEDIVVGRLAPGQCGFGRSGIGLPSGAYRYICLQGRRHLIDILPCFTAMRAQRPSPTLLCWLWPRMTELCRKPLKPFVTRRCGRCSHCGH